LPTLSQLALSQHRFLSREHLARKGRQHEPPVQGRPLEQQSAAEAQPERRSATQHWVVPPTGGRWQPPPQHSPAVSQTWPPRRQQRLPAAAVAWQSEAPQHWLASPQLPPGTEQHWPL
jgi:hypothetical protein